MNIFLNIPESKNDWENTRINVDHIVSYRHVTLTDHNLGGKDYDVIEFTLINTETHRMRLLNMNAKKVIKKIDKLVKVVKLELSKTDAK